MGPPATAGFPAPLPLAIDPSTMHATATPPPRPSASCAADKVFMPPSGMLALLGFASSQVRLGVMRAVREPSNAVAAPATIEHARRA